MSASLDPVIAEFYAGLPQQGPGSDADSEAALATILALLPPSPSVADLGCGTGRSTLFLGERLRTNIVAIELEPLFCERLAREAAARNLPIEVREGDMADPPLAPASLDLVWSEGAAYIIGFAEALRRWQALLRPGGFCVVSECTWLKDERPPEIARFFAEAYPDMADIAGNMERARSARYEPLATHTVSSEGWENYYRPIRQSVSDGTVDPVLARDLDEELAIFDRSAGSYGYVFYVLQQAVST
jgi:SAM-dependent methyltransferase